jgi:hypothetical protein
MFVFKQQPGSDSFEIHVVPGKHYQLISITLKIVFRDDLRMFLTMDRIVWLLGIPRRFRQHTHLLLVQVRTMRP